LLPFLELTEMHMKRPILLIGALFCALLSNAQVGINPLGSPANSNAGLDVDYSDKGFLPPRVTLSGTASSTPLGNHVAGMIVFNTATVGDVSPGMYFNNGSAWVPMSSSGGSAPGTVILIDADESNSSNVNVTYSPCGQGTSSGNLKTYALASNSYTRIIAEAEGYIELGANGGTYNSGTVTIILPSGASESVSARRNVQGGDTGNTGVYFPFKVSVSGASTSAGNITVDGNLSLGGCTGGKIQVNSLRVFGVQ
jgi:hypothetical protein